jgi:MFS transporter, OPA family, glycerol-3-phosphate transporter
LSHSRFARRVWFAAVVPNRLFSRLAVVAILLAVLGMAAVGFAQSAPAPTPAGADSHGQAVDQPAPAPAPAAAKPHDKPSLKSEIVPILILIVVITLVVTRLPRTEIQHSRGYRMRRAANWLPLGLTYAFLYMGRYNFTVLKSLGGISQHDFGTIDGVGSTVYALAFLLNGPIADRFGGRLAMLIGAAGAALANVLLGVMVMHHATSVPAYTAAFTANMYFQSFGAVAIVKVNAAWFHVRERGTFGGIFGILISLGIYFAFDWSFRIAQIAPKQWMFFVPAIILAGFWFLNLYVVRDRPSLAGYPDFDVGDAQAGHDKETAFQVIKRLLSNRIIVTIALIEACSGFLRQGILKWWRDFAVGVHAQSTFVYYHWGMVSCIAGITGGMFGGIISDHLFQSRRTPVAAVLYGVMLAGSVAILPALGVPVAVSWIIATMAMAIIGVHGMLSGTASADFGGLRNVGVAVGLIDGFVYLGTAVQDFTYGNTLPEKGTAASHQISSWYAWPGFMIPVAVVGLLLASKVWGARARPVAA